MKNTFRIIFVIFIITPTLSFGQESNAIGKCLGNEQKMSYSFISEYGLGIGGFFDDGHFSLELTGVLINGISFNKKQDMIGIGVGSELYYVVLAQTFPIFVNYRHYFPSKTNFNPLINVALGTRVSIWGNAGLYSIIAYGFRHKSLSFTTGMFMKSWGVDIGGFAGGLEIKVGYTF